MLDPNHLCMGCMRNMGASRSVCPYCGFQENEYISRLSPKILPPKTILEGKYLLGKVLGEGGFGITYLAWDLNLEIPLAIKEYFPNGLASRSCYGNQCSLSIVSGSLRSNYEHGLQRFADEARTLARLQKFPGIVNVRDFFFENSTGYLVMDYIKGMHLGAYVKKNGPFSVQEALSIMKPLIQSLQEVHKLGMIHRDISPDNILRETYGNLILIDFGSARMSTGEESKSLTILLKRGYAPLEQYQSHGRQGPWTDIYALCATLYYMMSGKVPQESIERISEDQLVPLHVVTEGKVSPETSRIIQAGLDLKASNRYQNLDALIKDLYPEKNPVPEKSPEEKQVSVSETYNQRNDRQTFKISKWLGICLLFFFILGIALRNLSSPEELEDYIGRPVNEILDSSRISLEAQEGTAHDIANDVTIYSTNNGEELTVESRDGICRRISSSRSDTSILQIIPQDTSLEDVRVYLKEADYEIDRPESFYPVPSFIHAVSQNGEGEFVIYVYFDKNGVTSSVSFSTKE